MSKHGPRILRLSVDEFTEKVMASEITLPPVLGEYQYSEYKNKKDLLTHEWQKLIEETSFISNECCQDLTVVGGTRSSARVRRAKAHLDTLLELQSNSSNFGVLDFFPLIEATELALEIAKGCLAKHNAQPKKFIAYDLETGKALNEPDYSNVDQAEILKSLGMAMSPQPNRAERRKMKRKGVLH